MTDKILEALEIGLTAAIEARIYTEALEIQSPNGIKQAALYVETFETAIELYKVKQAQALSDEETDGATIPKNGVIAKWLASDEGKEAIKKSLADSAETIAILNKARKVTFEQLNTPMGLTALPPAPVLSDAAIIAIRDSINYGDGWDGDQFDLVFARALLAKVMK